jgi:hypothetical protein
MGAQKPSAKNKNINELFVIHYLIYLKPYNFTICGFLKI